MVSRYEAEMGFKPNKSSLTTRRQEFRNKKQAQKQQASGIVNFGKEDTTPKKIEVRNTIDQVEYGHKSDEKQGGGVGGWLRLAFKAQPRLNQQQAAVETSQQSFKNEMTKTAEVKAVDENIGAIFKKLIDKKVAPGQSADLAVDYKHNKAMVDGILADEPYEDLKKHNTTLYELNIAGRPLIEESYEDNIRREIRQYEANNGDFRKEALIMLHEAEENPVKKSIIDAQENWFDYLRFADKASAPRAAAQEAVGERSKQDGLRRYQSAEQTKGISKALAEGAQADGQIKWSTNRPPRFLANNGSGADDSRGHQSAWQTKGISKALAEGAQADAQIKWSTNRPPRFLANSSSGAAGARSVIENGGAKTTDGWTSPPPIVIPTPVFPDPNPQDKSVSMSRAGLALDSDNVNSGRPIITVDSMINYLGLNANNSLPPTKTNVELYDILMSKEDYEPLLVEIELSNLLTDAYRQSFLAYSGKPNNAQEAWDKVKKHKNANKLALENNKWGIYDNIAQKKGSYQDVAGYFVLGAGGGAVAAINMGITNPQMIAAVSIACGSAMANLRGLESKLGQEYQNLLNEGLSATEARAILDKTITPKYLKIVAKSALDLALSKGGSKVIGQFVEEKELPAIVEITIEYLTNLLLDEIYN